MKRLAAERRTAERFSYERRSGRRGSHGAKSSGRSSGKVAFGRAIPSGALLAAYISTIAVIVLFCFFGFVRGGSVNVSGASYEKQYVSVRVEKGDTIYDIASEHMNGGYADINDYVDEIVSVNGLSSETIHTGEYITVPYYVSASE